MQSFTDVYEKIKVYKHKFGGGLRWNSIIEDIVYAYDLCFSNIEKQVSNEELWNILFNITESEERLQILYDNIKYKIFLDRIAWVIIEDPKLTWNEWKGILSLFEK
jgi:hypothetical protein